MDASEAAVRSSEAAAETKSKVAGKGQHRSFMEWPTADFQPRNLLGRGDGTRHSTQDSNGSTGRQESTPDRIALKDGARGRAVER